MPDKNLLIIHQGALGDFILAFPAIKRLHQYYQPIDVLCQSRFGKLAKALRIAENWFPIEAAYFSSLFSNQIDPQIKALLEKYKKIMVFTTSNRLEQSINAVSKRPSCSLPPKPPAGRPVHVAEFIFDHVYNCGLISKADARLDDILSPDRPVGQGSPERILLHPGAGSIRKRWPLDNFLQVESMLKVSGLKPEFVIGPAERDLAEDLQQTDLRLHVLDDLLELLELLSSAGGYIGNDSGASHLAAYCGLPTTVIFGPADPRRWTPIGPAVKIVRPALQCRPCFETEPENCDNPQCVEGISPREVLEVFYSVYKGQIEELGN